MKNRLKIVMNVGVFCIAAVFMLSAILPPAVSLGADKSQVQTDDQATPPEKASSPAPADSKKSVSTSTDDIEYDNSYDDDDDEWEG